MAPLEPDPSFYRPMLLMVLRASDDLPAGPPDEDPAERMRSRLEAHAPDLLSPSALPARGMIEGPAVERLGEHAYQVAAITVRALNDLAARDAGTGWVMLTDERIEAQVEQHGAPNGAHLPADAPDGFMAAWVTELAAHLRALLEPSAALDERAAFATLRASAGLAAECARRQAGPDPDLG